MIQMLLPALWFGVLTSISPCPLAMNIAAVSYLGKKISKPSFVLLSGFVYTLGRTVFYVLLGGILFYSFSAIPAVSDFLQTKMTYFVGPIMIVLGFILLDILKIKMPTLQFDNQKLEKRIDKTGLIGTFMVGFLFASVLCPVSAAFFFSNLIQSGGNPVVLLLYGIGTGLPVLLFAFMLAFCAEKIGGLYKKTALFETYARKITAVLFIGIGFYYLLGSIL